MYSRPIGSRCLEYLAQQENITIVPQFQLDTIHLLSGKYGPFKPLHEIEVPIWFAFLLYRAKVCKLKIPEWLSQERLRQVLQFEKENSSYYLMHVYASEIVKILSEECSELLEGNSCDVVCKLFGEIMILRCSKILKDLDVLRTTGIVTPGIKISNLTYNEIEKFRPVMLRVLNDGADLQNIIDTHSENYMRSEVNETFPSSSITELIDTNQVHGHEEVENSSVSARSDLTVTSDFKKRRAL